MKKYHFAAVSAFTLTLAAMIYAAVWQIPELVNIADLHMYCAAFFIVGFAFAGLYQLECIKEEHNAQWGL